MTFKKISYEEGVSDVSESQKEEKVTAGQGSSAVEKEAPKGGLYKSVFLLVVIALALFYGKDYLTGEREIPAFESDVPREAINLDAKTTDDKHTVVKDEALSPLLAQFQAQFPRALSPDIHVSMITYSRDKTKVLIEVERATQELGEKQREDLIFVEDEFGRYVNSELGIKLHP